MAQRGRVSEDMLAPSTGSFWACLAFVSSGFSCAGERGTVYFSETTLIYTQFTIIQTQDGLEFYFMLIMMKNGFAKPGIAGNKILEVT